MSTHPADPRTPAQTSLPRTLVDATAALTVAQLVLGLLLGLAHLDIEHFHAGVGLLTLVASIAAAATAWVKRSAVAVPASLVAAACVLQYALGEMHLTHAHMALGVIVLLLALWAAVRGHRRVSE